MPKAKPVGRWKLAYTFLLWFLVISLVPMGYIGFKLMNYSQDALRDQALHNQEAFAVGFANTVVNYLGTYKKILMEAAHQDDFTAGIGPQTQDRQSQVLNLLMQTHAAFLQLSVLDSTGREVLHKEFYPMRDISDKDAFQSAMQHGEYVGSLVRFQEHYPAITLAAQIPDRSQPSKPVGVLMAKLSLNGLSQMLNQEFPPEAGPRVAFVVSPITPDGFLVAHSSLNFIFGQNPRLPKEITAAVLTQTGEHGGNNVPLKDSGVTLLVAWALVKDLGWVVCVHEPLESAYQSILEEMQYKTVRALALTGFVICVVAWLLSGFVTRPIRALREAAERLGHGQFEEIPEIAETSSEIGDLAQTFQQMAESLREKTEEIVHGKEELERFNKFLDNRVKARERELRAAQDELITKERLAAIGQMASVVGHEIRNPLAVINNSTYFIKTKLAADGGSVDPKITKHIGIIESEIKQANGIINEILTFSRTRPLNLVVLAVNNFLEEILSVHPFPSHIQVVRAFTPVNPVVHIDADEMRQAVRNLIGNAVEVMPQGGTLKVVSEMVEDQWVRIDVGDSGPGIPPDVLDKIFAPFFTTKARGTGLGLAVVRKVVDRHRGKVDVESVVGRGTTFRIYLPLASKAAPSVGHPAAA